MVRKVRATTLKTDSSKQHTHTGSGTMNGELGLGAQCVAKDPIILNLCQDISTTRQRPFVTQISAGSSHSLVLTRQGQVFSFGSNRHGRLGLGDTHPRIRPNPVVMNMEDDKIVQVSAGDAHSLLLSSKGNVYSFGCGTHGQLGFEDDRSDRNRPYMLRDLSDPVARIFASHTRSYLLLKDGRVVLFGGNVKSSGNHDVKKKKKKMKLIEEKEEKKKPSVDAVGGRFVLPEFKWGSW